MDCQSKVDTAVGGAIGDKTVVVMHEIYEKLSESTQQKCERQRNAQGSHRTMERIESTRREVQQPWRNIREVAMEIRPGLCRICGSYEHSFETCYAVIKDLENGLGYEVHSSYNQPRDALGDTFQLDQLYHQLYH